jgi:dTDP-4-amino-4,6-dideoxygalactose transaminase
MQGVMDLAKKHNLLVIEDTAQALGGSFRGCEGVVIGDSAGGFSFYPAKLLGTYGDAGALVTNDEALGGQGASPSRSWPFA